VGRDVQQASLWWGIRRLRPGVCCPVDSVREARGLGFACKLGVGQQLADAKTAATCGNLLAVEPALWTFVSKQGVEATNNDAERALRHGVLWRHTSFAQGESAGDMGYASAPPEAVLQEEADMVEVSDYGFRIDRFEVTNASFAIFLNSRGNRVEDGVQWLLDEEDGDALIELGDGVYRARSGFADHPVIEVSWHGARRFCEWRGSVLPTALQWEQAASGSQGTALLTGNFYHEEGDGYGRTAPVGRFPQGAGPYGSLDMADNVWEWVAEADGTRRLILGGSWFNDAAALRRDWLDAAHPNEFTGFRCATPSSSRSPTDSLRAQR
jgi:formylglycine-generating enzyme required for sulfatase activity